MKLVQLDGHKAVLCRSRMNPSLGRLLKITHGDFLVRWRGSAASRALVECHSAPVSSGPGAFAMGKPAAQALVAGRFGLGWPLAVLATLGTPSSPKAPEPDVPLTCVLCDGSLAPSPATLSLEEALARGGAVAADNAAEIARLEQRWHAGEFGPPGSRAADRAAHRLARSRLKNYYAFLLPLADAREVRAVEPAVVAELSGRFFESGLFPTVRLRQLRVGRGRVCARYDLAGAAEEGVTVLGGRRLRYRVTELKVAGTRRRMLGIDWNSAGVGSVEVLLAGHFGFRLEHRQVADLQGGYDLLLALDVSGSWVRRFGTHRATGLAFWVSSPALDPAGDAPALRAGSAIYLPGLRLRLPVLPDPNLGDLRLLAPPQPFLPVEVVRGEALPAWLPLDRQAGLADWSGLGEIPPAVRELFPDR